VFEYFAGYSLDTCLKENKLNFEDKRSVFKQILYGVRDAHHNNIIHRDLKPANVLVSDDMRVKIIDFGISKFKDKNITQPGLTLGTPHYLAPELLVHGSQFADARSDIYALGQVFFEIVTGQNFWRFKGWKRMQDLIDFLKSQPEPTEVTSLAAFDCNFFKNAKETLARMVKIAPWERFSSVEEVINELDISTKTVEPLTVSYDFPVLIIESGSNRNARTFLNITDNAAIVMGRSDFASSDQSISRKHVEIRRQGHHYWIKDLGSRNGTMIAGNLLSPHESHELQHGDRIKLGDVFLRFAFLQKL
jgi:serine/threonine-protein kinase